MRFSVATTTASASLLIVVVFLGCLIAPVRSDGRALDNKDNNMVVSGRSMDWSYNFDDEILIIPRGRTMDGGVGADLSYEWNSEYGSVLSTIQRFSSDENGTSCKDDWDAVDDGGIDGMNEKGLGVHILFTNTQTQYAEADDYPEKNAIHYMRWARYLLDNFANVSEAVQGMTRVRIVSVDLCGRVIGTRAAIEDADGDSAIFEIEGGRVDDKGHNRVHVTTMTSDPSFSHQDVYRNAYTEWGGSIALPENLPTSSSSVDRFIRLTYYLKTMPEFSWTDTAKVERMRYVMASAVVPVGGGGTVTWWVSYMDLTNLVYYFHWMGSQDEEHDIISVDLKNVDFTEASPVLQLDPKTETRIVDAAGGNDPTSTYAPSTDPVEEDGNATSTNTTNTTGTNNANTTAPADNRMSQTEWIIVAVVLLIFMVLIAYMVCADMMSDCKGRCLRRRKYSLDLNSQRSQKEDETISQDGGYV